jgi:four helix bundle protein
MQLDRMRMYQAAERLIGEVDTLLPRIRTIALNQADHLDRSANSVLFNTAEGIGSFKPKIKINAYSIARKEANEVRAVLRSLVIKRIVTTKQIQKAYDLAGACVGMLTNAIIALEKRPDT